MVRTGSRKRWAMVALLGAAPPSLRGAVTISGVQNSASPIAFNENGTFAAAGNFAGPLDTRGTNVFQPEPLNGTTSPQSWTTGGVTATIASTNAGSLGATDLGSTTDDLYLTEIYSPDQSTLTLKLTGLNAATSYLIQFPHGEPRNYLYSGLQTFTDSSGNSASVPLAFGDVSGEQYAMISVLVSATNSLIYQMPASSSSGNRGPSFDGWDVRIAPEPDDCFLLALGAMLTRRRRKN